MLLLLERVVALGCDQATDPLAGNAVRSGAREWRAGVVRWPGEPCLPESGGLALQGLEHSPPVSR